MMMAITTEISDELTNEELAVLARDNEIALERLIKRNEGFVTVMSSAFLLSHDYHDQDIISEQEDYAQICRVSIFKAVKNYSPNVGVKFITYVARIMRNDMKKQFDKEKDYWANEIREPLEVDKKKVEESGGDYDGADDNGLEGKKATILDISPFFLVLFGKDYALIEQSRVNRYENHKENLPIHLNHYSVLLKSIIEKTKKKKATGIFLNDKAAGDSWDDPVFPEALKNLQITTVLKELLDKKFDPAQREYLIYRFNLTGWYPRSLKETAEHFNLSISYAKKIEHKALCSLKEKLILKQLL